MQVFLVRQFGKGRLLKGISSIVPDMPIVGMVRLVADPIVGRHHSRGGQV